MTSLEKEFAPYQESLELKELGFDEPCFGYYVDGEMRGINLGIEELSGKEPYYQRFGFHTLSNHDIDNPNKIVVTSPTFSQAFRFFREKYGLVKDLNNLKHDNFGFYIALGIKNKNLELIFSGIYKTDEEAELACLKKLIEIVKNG